MHAEWEKVYRQYRQQFFTYALSLTSCPERAEDAIQEAFMRLYQLDHLPTHRVAYAFRSVRNAALNETRHRQRALRELPLYIFDNGVSPEGEATRKEFREAVAGALRSLSKDRRETVVLHIYGGLTFQEISDVLELPLGTVTTWYRRGLEELRQRLKEYDE